MEQGGVSYRTPFYIQLREVIRNKIDEGEYPPGCAIPSESQLAETYGINRLTVRNAVDALVSEGTLRRVQGKGVFVVGERMERDLDTLSGFRQTMRDRNAVPSTKILVKARRKAGGKFASIFGIAPDDDLFFIRRLNMADDEPVSIEETFIPCQFMPKLEGIDLSIFTLYEAYGFYGICLARAWDTLDIVTLEARDARMLGIEAGSGVLLFTCISYDEQDRPIEYTRSYTRGDNCCFTIHNTSV